MSASKVAVIAQLTSVEGQDQFVAQLLNGYRDRVRQEPGNLVFNPSVSEQDATAFWVYEEYADVAAFQEHLRSAHNAEFNRAVGPHLVGGAARVDMLSPLAPEVDGG